MSKFESIGLFPQPIIKTNIGREWTEKEKDFISYHSENTYNNMGNTTSNDRYVLNAPEAKGFSDLISEGIKEYVEKVICPKHPLEFYVTQSWLNFTKTGQYHHTHEHPNSIISGVLYIDADEEKDKILFHNPIKYRQISIPTKEWNWFNSQTWFFQVKTGDMILFPSSLTHNVETKDGNNTRCSLAFNVFAKGYIGEEEQLTALHL